jgi:hypothetical protein
MRVHAPKPIYEAKKNFASQMETFTMKRTYATREFYGATSGKQVTR